MERDGVDLKFKNEPQHQTLGAISSWLCEEYKTREKSLHQATTTHTTTTTTTTTRLRTIVITLTTTTTTTLYLLIIIQYYILSVTWY